MLIKYTSTKRVLFFHHLLQY